MVDSIKNKDHIEYIKASDLLLAIIIYPDYKRNDNCIEFFTEPEYSQQLGYMNRPKGYTIEPHIHRPVERTITYTQEVLYIKSGLVKVDFYDNDRNYTDSRDLTSGTVILLTHGGHGFEIIENSEIIEIKQGPFAGDKDKERFKSTIN